MKLKKGLKILVLLLAASMLFTACGSKVNSDQTATVVPADTKPVVQEAPEPAPDTKATADVLLGKWQDVNSQDRFANITKVDAAYQYEDNEGAYPATFADGKLSIKLTDTEIATAYVDAATKHLYTEYQGSISEFKRNEDAQ